jgi:DNA-binding MarR family transcriptional regulator
MDADDIPRSLQSLAVEESDWTGRCSGPVASRCAAFPLGAENPMRADTQAKIRDCMCLAVRQAARYVTASYDQFLAPAGLRTTQFSILAKLKRQGPMTINALAADMVMDRTTLGRNILPLERDGLIRIEPLPSDRRSKVLHLTKAGEKRFEAASAGWVKAQARFESEFGDKRTAELRELLRAVVASELGPRMPRSRPPDKLTRRRET